jgi:hypothetical protein
MIYLYENFIYLFLMARQLLPADIKLNVISRSNHIIFILYINAIWTYVSHFSKVC